MVKVINKVNAIGKLRDILFYHKELLQTCVASQT